MGKKKAITEYVDKILEDIEDTENRMAALSFAIDGLRDRNNYQSTVSQSVEEQFSQIYVVYYRKLNDQFKYLLMYGVIDNNARIKAKKAAYEKYFAQKLKLKSGDSNLSFQRSGWYHDNKLEDEFLADIKSRMFADRDILEKDIVNKLEQEVVDETVRALKGDDK